MAYDRTVKYFDYLEDGIKIKSAGFIKIELINEICNVQININGLYSTDTFQSEVWISDGQKKTVLGEIALDKGRGTLQLRQLPAHKLGRDEISYHQLSEIYMKLGKNRELKCLWNDTNNTNSPKPVVEQHDSVLVAAGETVKAPKQPQKGGVTQLRDITPPREATPPNVLPIETIPSREIAPPIETAPSREVVPPIETIPLREIAPSIETAPSRETAPPIETVPQKEVAPPIQLIPQIEKAPQERESNPQEGNAVYIDWMEPTQKSKSTPKCPPTKLPRVFDDKWKQLCYLYKHINPFQDNREYLSITPNDFIVLNNKYHKLVNNSFLLHGYYNYEHLILGRVEQKGEKNYYIGVPGNFYDREKQVAVMFGFESFECKQEPAQNGDFGYYMMRVGI